MEGARLTRKGRTFKEVRVTGANANTDADVIALALSTAGETTGSVFGWDITRTPDEGVATVIIHTD